MGYWVIEWIGDSFTAEEDLRSAETSNNADVDWSNHLYDEKVRKKVERIGVTGIVTT